MKTFKKRLRSSLTQGELYSWGATWGARALYIGPALGLSPHRNAVAVVALGLDRSFAIANDPGNTSAGNRYCRSVLIPPNTLHHFSETAGRMAFLHVDASSRDFARLATFVRHKTKHAGFDLKTEKKLIELLRALSSGAKSWPEAKAELNRQLAGPHSAVIDVRVSAALDVLHADIHRRPSLELLARTTGVSASRLRRLFKAATGVPFRRYRIWVAMGAAARAIARGGTLTTAAMDAGFSSSAHFSAAYQEMFGMKPSRLIKARRENAWPT